MQIDDKEIAALMLLLSNMTQFDYGSYGLSYKERVTVQLMYGRLVKESQDGH